MSLFSYNAMNRLLPDAMKNSPIEHDLFLMTSKPDQTEDNNYEQLARQRCKDEIVCYAKDQSYYLSMAGHIDDSIERRSTQIDQDQSQEENIKKMITDTSALIDQMIPFSANLRSMRQEFQLARFLHDVLNTRMHFIEFMKTNSTLGIFEDIKDTAEILKTRMIENIMNTAWLYRDKMSRTILEQIKERVESIQIYHDFDECDQNITTLQQLNRDFNHLYFAQIRRTGAHGLDTMLRLHGAFTDLMQIVNSGDHASSADYVHRIMFNFKFNAFFDPDGNRAIIHAPIMYREAFHSDIITEPFITYFILGHELYHSLFFPGYILLDVYGHRTDCITTHYEKSCSKFAMGSCMSGQQTIGEDGADLESYRLMYALLRERYSDEELNKTIDGLDTTVEQAFFYYTASANCEKDKDRSELHAMRDPHSANNIRVNAPLSLMPEFSNAFGCKEGDAMYVEQTNSCYVFGPNSW